MRLAALRRFAIAITVLNTLGHTILGFETSLAQLCVSAGTAYLTEIILELASAWSERRRPAFLGGFLPLVNFLLPAHISGFAISMLLYAGDRLLPFVFAATVAITSKALFVVTVKGRSRHFLNPSNTGLAAAVFLFPWVAIAPPYHFTEDITGIWDWGLPALVVCTGTILNAFFTRKIPLIVSWLLAFAAQAVIRHFLYETWLLGSLAPMTGLGFLLFTFYMVSDPGTTPVTTRGQIGFGVTLGLTYGVVVALHIVFPMFIALLTVCAARGLLLHVLNFRPAVARERSPAPAIAVTEPRGSRPAVL